MFFSWLGKDFGWQWEVWPADDSEFKLGYGKISSFADIEEILCERLRSLTEIDLFMRQPQYVTPNL